MARLRDLLAKDLDVVFCGINPGLSSAAAGHHFAQRSNRFWRVLHQAGFTTEEIRPENDRDILRYRCGLTAVVERPTAGARELASSEFVAASGRFRRKIGYYRPRFVAFLGKRAYSALSGRIDLSWGYQEGRIGGAAIWLLPNTSGRNLAFSLEELVGAYRAFNHTVRKRTATLAKS